jgi:hypothetical protein
MLDLAAILQRDPCAPPHDFALKSDMPPFRCRGLRRPARADGTV